MIFFFFCGYIVIYDIYHDMFNWPPKTNVIFNHIYHSYGHCLWSTQTFFLSYGIALANEDASVICFMAGLFKVFCGVWGDVDMRTLKHSSFCNG